MAVPLCIPKPEQVDFVCQTWHRNDFDDYKDEICDAASNKCRYCDSAYFYHCALPCFEDHIKAACDGINEVPNACMIA